MSEDRAMWRKVADTFTLIREWQDEPEDGRSADDWPFPDQHAVSLIGGPLAARICRRFDMPEGTPVTIEELIESGGYSEYTQENDYSYTVRCGGKKWESGELWYGGMVGGVGRLLAWLDAEAES